MAIIGFANLVDNALPSLWDADEMTKVKMAGGATLEGVISELNSALTAAGGEFLAHPQYSGLISVQDMPEVDYRSGSQNGVDELTEYGTPEPEKGETKGHMIPLRTWGKALGWTHLSLPERRTTQIEADIMTAVQNARDNFQKRALRRFFMMEGETVGATSNASLPFVDGTGTGSGFVPPTSPDGNSFANTHDHFLRVDALSTANVDAHIKTLMEHGHVAPFHIIASETDAGSWAALTSFVPPSYEGIVYATDTDRAAAIKDVMTYRGIYKSPHGPAWIWSTPRLPTNYYGIYKSYGPGDMRNPLRLRINPIWGFGFKVIPGQYVLQPLQLAAYRAQHEFGVGQDRTNGVCVYVAGSGDYVTPTIS